MRHFLSMAAVTSLVFLSVTDAKANKKSVTGQELLKRVEKNYVSQSEAATLTMKTIEKNGSSKTLKMRIKRKGDKSDKKHRAIVRIIEPKNLKGTGLLSISEDGSNDQRIYLPSQNKSRRILSNQQGDSFLGSELSMEDMGGSGATQFLGKIKTYEKQKDQEVAVVEITPSKGESSYSKIISWIPTKQSIVLKTEYYDLKGKLKKVATFKDYQKFGEVWRAKTIHIVNKQNQRQTVVTLEDLKLNEGIDNSEFTKVALEDY